MVGKRSVCHWLGLFQRGHVTGFQKQTRFAAALHVSHGLKHSHFDTVPGTSPCCTLPALGQHVQNMPHPSISLFCIHLSLWTCRVHGRGCRVHCSLQVGSPFPSGHRQGDKHCCQPSKRRVADRFFGGMLLPNCLRGRQSQRLIFVAVQGSIAMLRQQPPEIPPAWESGTPDLVES